MPLQDTAGAFYMVMFINVLRMIMLRLFLLLLRYIHCVPKKVTPKFKSL